MQAAKINVVIPEDHRLELKLPDELPPGPAEVIVLVVPKKETAPDRRALLGIDRGRVHIAADFDAPLPDEIQRAFEGGDD
jgi:hypothetical protein